MRDTAWKLTDSLNLDAGLRWNQDRKTASVYQAQYASIAPDPACWPTRHFSIRRSRPPDSFCSRRPPPGFSRTTPTAAPSSNVSPRLGVDYHFTPQVMTYVSYSKGFKSGGFDMRGNAAVYPQTENGYNSETADNYEAWTEVDAARRHPAVESDLVLRSLQERADRRAAIRRYRRRAAERHRGA